LRERCRVDVVDWSDRYNLPELPSGALDGRGKDPEGTADVQVSVVLAR